MKLTHLSPVAVLRALAGLGIALAITSATGAHAATAYYFDGGSQRSMTLEPNLVAQFRTPGAAGARVAGSSGPFVTIVDATQPGAQSAMGSTSPVYREGNSPAGRLMALPGGVVVNFKSEWTAAQIQAWALEGGHTLGQRMNILGNWYVIKTAAGNASLDTANAIQRSGAVLSATPNWWMQTATR
ncbi:MAG: hypothetical protein CFE43_03860 [Burkholderiales bacterium PBB3]|nr:MAG: hypothetical protein CFE43_03860 [Burkholderiales bacterium PBB3]